MNILAIVTGGQVVQDSVLNVENVASFFGLLSVLLVMFFSRPVDATIVKSILDEQRHSIRYNENKIFRMFEKIYVRLDSIDKRMGKMEKRGGGCKMKPEDWY